MMEWVHTLTIIVSGFGYTAAIWYIVREDIKWHDTEIQEMCQEFKDARCEGQQELKNVRREGQQELKDIRQEMKEKFTKGHALWATLLEKICTIEKQILKLQMKK
ncbi:MAG: hypothetical protein JSS34_06635 [Proteobacteria bacterium]|nr:hypothetical protein [Pseudomonadota bacterium]